MDCKKAERLLLRSLDGRLEDREKIRLKDHIEDCSHCQKAEREYRMILGHLKKEGVPEPLPYFNERLLAKLNVKEKTMPGLIWQKWATRTLAFSLAAIILIGGAFLILRPREPQQLSQVEALLLRDENPLTETQNILDARGPENRNMMLIFTAMEEKDSPRR
jgi:anti-sigma factor RsiW